MNTQNILQIHFSFCVKLRFDSFNTNEVRNKIRIQKTRKEKIF